MTGGGLGELAPGDIVDGDALGHAPGPHLALRVAGNENGSGGVPRRRGGDAAGDGLDLPPQPGLIDQAAGIEDEGEHKGYALAFICELLAGVVTGGGTLTPKNQGQDTITNNMLAFILDPRRLVDQAWLRQEIEAITGCVTASPPRDPAAPVLIPGDPERQMRARRMAEGISIDDVTWRQLAEAAAGHGVKLETGGG